MIFKFYFRVLNRVRFINKTRAAGLSVFLACGLVTSAFANDVRQWGITRKFKMNEGTLHFVLTAPNEGVYFESKDGKVERLLAGSVALFPQAANAFPSKATPRKKTIKEKLAEFGGKLFDSGVDDDGDISLEERQASTVSEVDKDPDRALPRTANFSMFANRTGGAASYLASPDSVLVQMENEAYLHCIYGAGKMSVIPSDTSDLPIWSHDFKSGNENIHVIAFYQPQSALPIQIWTYNQDGLWLYAGAQDLPYSKSEFLKNLSSKGVYFDGLTRINLPKAFGEARRVQSRNLVIEAEKENKDGPSKLLPDLVDVETTDSSNESTSALGLVKNFTRDLTEQFQSSPIRLSHVDREVRTEALRGLLSVEKGGTLIMGKGGSGRTTEIEGLISDLANGVGPEELRGYRFIEIIPGLFTSGAGLVTDAPTRVTALLKLNEKNKIIWVVRGVEQLKHLGKYDKSQDFAELIAPSLKSGKLKLLASAEPDQFSTAFGADYEFRSSFKIIRKSEISPEKMVPVVRSWFEMKGFSPPDETTIREGVRLSEEFLVEGVQPGKAISLFKEASNILRSEGHAVETMNMQTLYKAIQSMHGSDAAQFSYAKRGERVDGLQSYLDSKFAGRAEVKKWLVEKTEQVLSGLHEKGKPRLRALFLGPKGQGKTELAIEYAKGMGLEYEVIAMNAVASSREYVPIMERIARAVIKNPNVVLIIDELEKVTPAGQEELLQYINSGRFSVLMRLGNDGFTTVNIYAPNATVFFTSNAGEFKLGASDFGYSSGQGGSSQNQLRKIATEDGISDKLLDRMEHLFAFRPLDKVEFKEALRIHLSAALEALKRSGKMVSIPDLESYLDYVMAKHFTPGLSTREVTRILEESLRMPLTRAARAARKEGIAVSGPASKFEISIENGDLSCVGSLQ